MITDPLLDSPELTAFNEAIEADQPIIVEILRFLEDAQARGETEVVLPEDLQQRALASSERTRETYEALMAKLEAYDAQR